MATESERCVDELMLRKAKIEAIIEELDKTGSNAPVMADVRNILLDNQLFIDNNKSIIPSYCLKQMTGSLKRLQAHLDRDASIPKFQFKSKPQVKSSDDQIHGRDEPAGHGDDKQSQAPHLSATPSSGFINQDHKQLKLNAGEVEGKDISLINLSECVVTITGLANTVYVSDLNNCQVTVFVACRAITVRNCVNCRFKLVCQQLRIDSTRESKFEIFTSARSMLESSEKLEFCELILGNVSEMSEEEVSQLLARANFDPSLNNWRCIDDFDWLSPNTKSKNFVLVE